MTDPRFLPAGVHVQCVNGIVVIDASNMRDYANFTKYELDTIKQHAHYLQEQYWRTRLIELDIQPLLPTENRELE